MITTTSYSNSSNRASTGQGYDGVVRLSVAGYYGTGALLFDGRAILTAAHLFIHGATTVSVMFETSNGSQTVTTSKVLVNPNYDSVNENNDLAIVWLTDAATITANRYGLYRDINEIGQTMTMVGYGTPGTGSTGLLTGYNGSPLRLKASNKFDADAATLKSYLGSTMVWTPLSGSQLVADFDDGSSTHDALGRLINLTGTGLGASEGLISPGDSGGPAFISGLLAGVASYTSSLSFGGVNPDSDSSSNSSFGEVAAWQRVSNVQQWIDQSIRANYADAPTKPADVKTSVTEENTSTHFAYFLVQFTGVRSNPNQILSVDYATRNGTATAGSDYLAVSGKLNLYPDENQAVIPVEIIGDVTPEPNETFYLDVFNPVGGSFGGDLIKLTAVRTLVDDDGWSA
jgi:secreted trypsin-like serine protease